MADIAHTVPASVAFLDGSEFGFTRPGIQVTPFISGRYLTRDWHGFNVATYDLMPALFDSSADTLEEWEAFWRQIGGGALAGYVVDPGSATHTHRDLLCGGIADGTKTTFPIPVVSPTPVWVFVDGVKQSSGYGASVASNLLTDAQAECSDSSIYGDSNTTSVGEGGMSAAGLSCIKTTHDGGANPTISTSSITTGLSASKKYTAAASILATNSSAQNYRVNVWWYESDDTYISNTLGSDVSVQASDGWTVVSDEHTSPALSAKARVAIQRNDTDGTDAFYLDCVTLNRGDYNRWHLPSVSPGLIEFDSAPSSGARITVNAEGQRVTRCRFEPGTRWSMSAAGHASVRSIRATEWVEF